MGRNRQESTGPIPVVDVFAGPGGLNEGFSAVRGGKDFRTVVSIEMDAKACDTLRLRAAFRSARRDGGRVPKAYYDFVTGLIGRDALERDAEFGPHWKEALSEVRQHELAESSRRQSDSVIAEALGDAARGEEPWVLIGGPPCQAYSLVGRSRRKHDATFKDDHKHTLYREYLHIIERFSPHVFVMENVKGMLSSQHDGGGVFQRICDDLRTAGPGYELRSFVAESDGDPDPREFIIRAENHGVPQARHRVILLGIRNDIRARRDFAPVPSRSPVPIEEAIGDLPKIRSGLSPRRADSWEQWRDAYLLGSVEAMPNPAMPPKLSLGMAHQVKYEPRIGGSLGEWLVDPDLPGVLQHTSRHHMASDLSRYAFLAHRGRRKGRRPRVNELPSRLMPNHANARREDAPFADRFRVQLEGAPSSTVTSHIAKDGHYYIHFDPKQMRSLSVREAARLQTFPDNYFFMGNRTEQYHQVGNAVPPFLARQLAEVVAEVLGRR